MRVLLLAADIPDGLTLMLEAVFFPPKNLKCWMFQPTGARVVRTEHPVTAGR